jgi:hypothetical protein
VFIQTYHIANPSEGDPIVALEYSAPVFTVSPDEESIAIAQGECQTKPAPAKAKSNNPRVVLKILFFFIFSPQVKS